MKYRYFHIALIATLVVAGCETQVQPVEEGGPGYYVFGALHSDSLVQTLRVEALRTTAYDPPSPERPEVVLADLETGERHACVPQAATPTYRCGAPRIVPGRAYQVRISGERGETWVDLQTPSVPGIQVGTVFMPGVGAVLQPLQWFHAGSAPASILVTYVTVRQGNGPDTTTVDYLPFVRTTGSERNVTLDFRRDLDFYRGRKGIDPADTTVLLKEVSFSLAIQGPEWDRPEGTTNVENGYGFVGTRVGTTIRIPVKPEVVRRLGFQPAD